MIWWFWILLGLALLFLETAAPGGFVAFFFGISALVVGGLNALGWSGPPWMQWGLFSTLSLLALLTLRKTLRARLNLEHRHAPVDTFIGESAVALDDLSPGSHGKVEFRGSSWNGRVDKGAMLTKGQRCIVEKVEGLTLWVRPE